MKKGTTILLLALLAVVFLAVSCKNDPPPHVHTYDMTSWGNDDADHWRKATCEHTEEVKDKAAHTWNEGEETIPAEPGKEGIKTYTCTVCGRKKTEKIDPLPPMTTSSIKFVDGYTLDKTYNNEPISIDKSNVVRVVDGVETQIDNPDAISFLFKQFDADDSTYIAEAPKKPGHYMVKVIVAASPEWTEKEYVQGFYIDKIKLKGDYDLKNSLAYKGESHLISELILTRADLPCILEGETVVIKDIRTNKNAGRIEVDSYKIVENEYYDDLDLPEFRLYATVTPFNISAAINISKVYDGTTNAEFAAWGATIPEADRGKLILTVTADGKDVGTTHSPTNDLPVVFYLDGASTNNYTIDKSKISINITARPLSFNEDPTAVYDGSNTKVVAKPEIIKGLVDGESLTITIETGHPDVLRPTATPPTNLGYTIESGTNTILSNYQIKQSEIDRARIAPRELQVKPNSTLSTFEYNNSKYSYKVFTAFDNVIPKDNRNKIKVEFTGTDAGSTYKDYTLLTDSYAITYNYKLSAAAQEEIRRAKINPKTLNFFGKYYMEKKGNVLLFFMLPSNIPDIGLIQVQLKVPEEHANWEYDNYYTISTTSGWTLTPSPRNDNFTVKILDPAIIEVRQLQSGSPTVTAGGSEQAVTADAHGHFYCRIDGVTEGEKYKITVKNGTETVSYDKMTLRSTGSSYIVQYIDPDSGIFEYNGGNGRLLQLHAELIENQIYKVKVTKETKK